MPWDNENFPDSMKNLDKNVREKAIRIANTLLNLGLDERKAAAIAVSRARKPV